MSARDVIRAALGEWAGDYWEEGPNENDEGPTTDILAALMAAGYTIAAPTSAVPDYPFVQGHLCAARSVLEEAMFAAAGDVDLGGEIVQVIDSVRAVIKTVQRRALSGEEGPQ